MYDYNRYEAPKKIDVHYPSAWYIFPLAFHTLALVFWVALRAWAEIKVEDKPSSHWWLGTRNLANRKARKHGKYFENETTVTEFKRSLDEPLPTKEPEPELRPKSTSEIILLTRDEAEQVLLGLRSLLEKYEVATLADLYDLVGINSMFVDRKRGWTDLLQVQIRQTKSGWFLDLPEPKLI